MNRNRLNRLATLLIAATLVVSACKRGGRKRDTQKPAGPQAYTGDLLAPAQAQGEPARGGVLRIAMTAEPPSLNYQLDPLDGWGKKVAGLVLDNMARPNPRTWKHEPRLAERWEISDDKLDFTFFLRKGVRWHDGEPFDADDVVFTFKKLLDPSTKAIAIRSYLEPIERIEKIDSHTVRFHLKTRYWLAFDTIAEIYIYPQHVYEKGDFNTHPANRAPIGTGPFQFVHWRTGDEIALKRYDGFYGGPPHLDRIVFKYVPDPTVRTQLLLRGDVDAIETLSPDEWRARAEAPGVATRFWRLRHIPAGLQWIGWNQARPMFADARVRRALTMLLDRKDIVDNLRLGLDTEAVSWFYPGTEQHDAGNEPWPYDPDEAANLLDEAGWTDSDRDGVRDKDGRPFAFTFLYPAGPPFYGQLASLMEGDYEKAGIKVTSARVEWAVYTERLRKHEFDACSMLWKILPRNDPYQVWHSSEVNGGSNFVSFVNDEADRILETARTEFDDEKRVALYRRFNRILHAEQPYTMLFNRYNLSLVSRRFGGIVSTPYGVFNYADFYVRADGVPGLERGTMDGVAGAHTETPVPAN